MVELIVVITLIGILAAGVLGGVTSVVKRSRAANASAALDRVAQAERTFADTYGGYSDFATDLDVGRDLTVVSHTDPATSYRSTGPGVVSVALAADGTLGMAVLDGSGVCQARSLQDVQAGAAETSVALAASAICEGGEALAGKQLLTPASRKF